MENEIPLLLVAISNHPFNLIPQIKRIIQDKSSQARTCNGEDYQMPNVARALMAAGLCSFRDEIGRAHV